MLRQGGPSLSAYTFQMKTIKWVWAQGMGAPDKPIFIDLLGSRHIKKVACMHST